MLYMEEGWAEALKEEFEKPYMRDLQAFLASEVAAGSVIYPPQNQIFTAFCETPFSKVKVVIVGQDPYHNPGQAHGLSFSVAKGVSIPPSLRNMYQELKSDLGISPPNHGYLLAWAKQGVLMLNATLTVRANEPKSHYGKGWEQFTDAAIQKLARVKKNLVFLLWGKSAKEKCEHIVKGANHLMLEAPHPSPYSASSGFFSCKHFSKANDFLRKNGEEPIDWTL
jgi:uracil-DNA glycosylase